MDIHEKFGLKQVINASGKMSILGVSKYSDKVAEAQKKAGQSFFVLEELLDKTGEYVAKLIGSESAIIVSSASAGIVQSISGIIGKGNHYHIYHPYTDTIKKREIIIPKGHNIDYGTSIETMVTLGGGKVIEAGYANVCYPRHIEDKISPETAAILYIKSHHTVQKSMINTEEAIKVAHDHGIPIIIDAAAEGDLKKYIKQGADIVIYSGAKAIEGPSSGVVFGTKQLIEWVKLQSKGIGRAMKIGKENIVGLTVAIDNYMHNKAETGESMQKRMQGFVEEMNKINNVTCKIVQDGVGRDIYRASFKLDPKASISIEDLVSEMKEANPAVYTREYQMNNDIIEFDVRMVNSEELDYIAETIKTLLRKEQ